MTSELSTVVFNIQRFCLHDGPGLRTTVFFKGCPLRCLWCSNPESMSSEPELGFASARCDKCAKCLPVCSLGAITLDSSGLPQMDRGKCNGCGDCVKVCFPEALAIYGQRQSLTEVVAEVRKDEGFFGADGGVTVSGGEPLLRAEFVAELFKRCHEVGISTCIETSGAVQPQAIREVLAHVDTWLFDLKSLNVDAHRWLTGQPNKRVIENARLIASQGKSVQFRMPLIPGLNDAEDNIEATAAFLRTVQNDEACIELMPYHRFGAGKYEALGRQYTLNDLRSPTEEYLSRLEQAFAAHRVQCLVSK